MVGLIERGPAARSTCARVAFVIESTQHVYVRKESEFKTTRASQVESERVY